MVALSPEVISAFSVGNSDNKAATRTSSLCCSRSTRPNALLEAGIASLLCRSSSEVTLWRTTSRQTPEIADEIMSVAKMSWVRRRKRTASPSRPLLPARWHKFVSRAVQRQEVLRVGGIGLQLLPEPQDMIVNRASGRIIMISPHLVE